MLCSVKQQPVNYDCRCTVQLGIHSVYYTVQCFAVQQNRAVQQSVNWDCHWSLTTKLQSLQCATWWWSSSSFYWHHEQRHGWIMMVLRYLLCQNSEDFLCLPACRLSKLLQGICEQNIFFYFDFCLWSANYYNKNGQLLHWPKKVLSKHLS